MKTAQINKLDQIIAKFDAHDDKALVARTSELDSEMKIKHIESMFTSVRFCDLEPVVLHLMMNSVDFQELATAFIWDALLIAASYERAMQIDMQHEAA